MLAAALAAGAALSGGPAWRTVEAPLALSFPRDHAAHPDFRTEWWYVTGLVEAGNGRRFGYQLTFFRQGTDASPRRPEESGLRARQVVAAHLAVADLANHAFLHDQRLRRTAGGLAGYATGDLDVWVEGWELRREPDGTLTLRAAAQDSGIALALRLRPQRPVVLHGAGGVSTKGPEPGNASAYLSWTRLATSGTLRVGGTAFPVAGASWLDHEWGSSQLGADVVGWDWVGLRLADGRDLMLYRLRRADGTASPFSGGTVVSPEGGARHLGAGDFSWDALTTWTSPHTGGVYPATVRVRAPGEGLDLRIVPMLADAELDSRASTGTVYWEGPVRAEGSAAGEGYMELTGYAGTLRGRF